MDLQPRPFANFDELADYCYHVASAVGLCCLHIWGYRSEGGKAEPLAEACGIALQLTNILRDVREDARNGRIYLPRTTWPVRRRAPRSWTRTGPATGSGHLLAFEARGPTTTTTRRRPARPLVDAGRAGRSSLTIVGIYRALLDEIARRDYDVSPAGWRFPPGGRRRSPCEPCRSGF